MPEPVRKDFGGSLDGIQFGRTPNNAKALKGKAKGAMQLSEDYDGDTYRAIYTTELDGVIYVLHCFQKKSKSGAETPQADINLIEARLKAARADHARRTKRDPS